MQTDPAGYGGTGLNLYAYAGNDAANSTDPTGLDPCNPNYVPNDTSNPDPANASATTPTESVTVTGQCQYQDTITTGFATPSAPEVISPTITIQGQQPQNGTNNPDRDKVCRRTDEIEGLGEVITGLGLLGQGFGYGSALLSIPEGDVPGVLGGLIIARRAGALTAAGSAIGIAGAGYGALHGQTGAAAATIINKVIAGRIAPEGYARNVLEFALDKADSDAVSRALGCR